MQKITPFLWYNKEAEEAAAERRRDKALKAEQLARLRSQIAADRQERQGGHSTAASAASSTIREKQKMESDDGGSGAGKR